MSEVKVNKITPRTDCGTTQLGDSGDTVTVTGDLRSNSLKAADGGVIISQSGTTITLGASGDTVSLASGASQSGFGRTGTVNWNTTKISSDPGPAVSGVGYFTDTSGSAFNVTLPSSPSAGDIVAVADYANTWDTNNLTVARNSSNIEGEASNFICNIEGGSITFVYVDATKGWIVTNTGQSGDVTEAKFIAATGGTVTTVCTNFKVHTFTGPGTFCVSCAGNAVGSNTVSYFVVAGGGGGGKADGGGGGAGGVREGKASSDSYTASPLNAPTGVPVTATAFPITVGGGGSAPGSPDVQSPGGVGSNSVFSTITSAGGGFGAGNGGPSGGAGGSGGGGAVPGPASPGGAGNTPSVSPPQGNNGGSSEGGGGGATAVGGNGPRPGPAGTNGGAGATTQIPGSPLTKGAGGQGAKDGPSTSPEPANTGNGGDGVDGGGGGAPGPGQGSSGIVIIRYKFQ
jgi:hypothetical protein